MHKIICAVLLVAVCVNAQVAIPATRLESENSLGSLSASFSSAVSGSASIASGSSSGSGSGCQPAQPACQAPTDNKANQGASVDDAVKPVDDWLKDFKKRTMGGTGENLYKAAQNTVGPLLKKLKDTMKRAQEKLVDSNRSILRHVEEATVAHIYNLLKADKARQAAEEQREEHVQRIMDAKESQKEAQDKANAALGISSEAAKKLESVLGSTAGTVPSQSVIDKIAKVLSESSSAAAKSISSALKKAASESSSSLKSGSSSKSKSSSASGSSSK